jgi:hypothetical protein
MRYRKLDSNGDMTFGHGAADFWKDQVEAVGQAVKTRLLLFSGEWYLDTTAGTPWGGFPLNDLVVQQGRILAEHTQLSRDAAIRDRIATTEGVIGMPVYGSSFNPNTRTFSVNATIDTIYGQFELAVQAVPGIQPTIELTVPYVAPIQPVPTLQRLPQPSKQALLPKPSLPLRRYR